MVVVVGGGGLVVVGSVGSVVLMGCLARIPVGTTLPTVGRTLCLLIPTSLSRPPLGPTRGGLVSGSWKFKCLQTDVNLNG